MRSRSYAFTLIELLIVVAIIAILAAIAVPNFLEAQVRSKVARTKADMRSVAVALESYSVDFGAYPPSVWVDWPATNYSFAEDSYSCLWRLTTPVAYITSSKSLHSPFEISEQPPSASAGSFQSNAYWYVYAKNPDGGTGRVPLVASDHCFWWAINSALAGRSVKWLLGDAGPNKVMWNNAAKGIVDVNEFPFAYDPSNGTVSGGNIYRFGP